MSSWTNHAIAGIIAGFFDEFGRWLWRRYGLEDPPCECESSGEDE